MDPGSILFFVPGDALMLAPGLGTPLHPALMCRRDWLLDFRVSMSPPPELQHSTYDLRNPPNPPIPLLFQHTLNRIVLVLQLLLSPPLLTRERTHGEPPETSTRRASNCTARLFSFPFPVGASFLGLLSLVTAWVCVLLHTYAIICSIYMYRPFSRLL